MGNNGLAEFANALDALVRDFIALGLPPDEIARLLKLRANILQQDKK